MLYNILIFIFGAIVGSFLNVCIHRLPKGESIVMPASHCTACVKPIPWYDNIPIISYILLRGKCRFCDTRIPLRYPIVEILTAAIALALFVFFGLDVKFFAYLLMVSGLIVATFVDFAINEIPDEISIGGCVAGLVLAFVFPKILGEASGLRGLVQSGLGALAGAGSVYLMGFLGELVFRKEAMGGGDVKFMAMIGSFMGWKLALFVFFIAPFFGSVVGIVLRIRDGRKTIPYGPYLSLAAVIAVFWGEKILRVIF